MTEPRNVADWCAVPISPETSSQLAGVRSLKETVRRYIDELQVAVSGWGLLSPGTVIGDYRAGDAYLLLVFDAQGHPHTTTLALEEIEQFKDWQVTVEAQLRELIAPLSPVLFGGGQSESHLAAVRRSTRS